MLLPISLICNPRKTRRDGTSLIQIQYCFSAERKTLLNTEIAVPPKYWIRKRRCISDALPSSFGNVSDLNTSLTRMLRTTEDIICFCNKNDIDPVRFVKETFTPSYNSEDLYKKKDIPDTVGEDKSKDFFYQIDDYIKSKSRKVTPAMLKVYNTMRGRLKMFEEYQKKPISFDSIDFTFYEDFVEYLTYTYVQRRRKTPIVGLRAASLGHTIKQFRIFIRDRVRRKIIPPIDLTDFKILDEESDAIYLTTEEIIRIYHLNLSDHPELVTHRNLLVVGCLTGLRFSDFSTIRHDDIRSGMLYKKQDKSDRWVVIPLRDIAEDILCNHFKNGIPFFWNTVFNRAIKEIGKLAGISQTIKFSHKKGKKDIVTIKPKYAWITSHTCRRSFCTNEFLAGTPVELIMKISGHKSLRDFYKYIRISPEEAGQKIKEIWQNRGEMKMIEGEKKVS